MSEIIQIRFKKKTKPSRFSAIRHVLLSEHTSLHVLMITWHRQAAVSHGDAHKQ